MNWEDFIHKFVGRMDGGSFQHVALDVEREHALVVLSEWIFRWRPSRRKLSAQLRDDLKAESVKYMRVLDAMDVEMQQLAKLKDHGLVRYRSWKYGFENDHVFAYVSRLFLFWFDHSWFFPHTFTNYRVISDRWYAIMYTGLRWRQCWRNMPRFPWTSADYWLAVCSRPWCIYTPMTLSTGISNRHRCSWIIRENLCCRTMRSSGSWSISVITSPTTSRETCRPAQEGTLLIDRLIDWLCGRDRLVDRLIDWLCDRDWLIDYVIVIDWLCDWALDWLIIID